MSKVDSVNCCVLSSDNRIWSFMISDSLYCYSAIRTYQPLKPINLSASNTCHFHNPNGFPIVGIKHSKVPSYCRCADVGESDSATYIGVVGI
jgi:hypothetical protein